MPGRIVVGVDGSGSSRMALRWAADEARRRDADLDVVFAWHRPEPNLVPVYEIPPQTDLEGDARKTVEEVLAAEGFDRAADLTINPIVAAGSAAPLLLDAAKGADLLVVGSRGRGGFAGMLLGSVSQHCVSHATCPVVVVRSGEESED